MVERKTLESRAADELRGDLVDGRIAPGTRLTEIDVASRLDVSRGTVRLALQTLASEGLVELTPYSGWCARSFSADDAWELAVLRGSLDGLAAELAASRAAAVGTESVREAMEQLASVRSVAPGALTAADFGVHRSIVELSGHSRLLGLFEQFEAQTLMLISYANNGGLDVDDIVAQHKPIVEAICAGDGVRARLLAEAHGRESGDLITASLTTK